MAVSVKSDSGFNPHSHEGSDNICRGQHDTLRRFNPHSHEGSDSSTDGHVSQREVSIHTPTRGVTCGGVLFEGAHDVSIHTPTRGVTLIERDLMDSGLFQSTLPRGE